MQLELPLQTRSRTRLGAEVVRAVRMSGRVLTYRLRRSSRRTLALYVDSAGIRAAAPRWVAISEIERFMREKERWIFTKLAESAIARTPSFEWRAGSELSVFGVLRRVELHGDAAEVTAAGDRLVVPLRFGAPPQLRAKASVAPSPWRFTAALSPA